MPPTRRNTPEPEQPEAAEGDAAIVGEVVTLAAVQPSAEQAKATRERAKGRTAQQLFPAAAAAGFGLYLLRLWGVDLNPLPDSEEMPVEQVGYLVVLLGWVITLWMNREPSASDNNEDNNP